MVWAWTITVGWPSWRGPLKRVSGELVGTGPEGEVDQRFELAGADDRPLAELPGFGDARGGDPFRWAGRQPSDVEATVAVEVEDDLFERRRARLRRAC